MNRFTEIVPLVLTPLTPIHIGCGEDFEPTNYVIEGGMLYPFEPTDLSLSQEDRERLIRCVSDKRSAIQAVQRFFHQRLAACRKASRFEVPVVSGVSELYEARVGRAAQRESGGRVVINRLEIERTAHHPYSGKPYLPGSSLKGSVRTGWLNGLDKGPPIPRDRHKGADQKERSADVERDLLGGSFSSDPFRLIEFADAAGGDLKSRVVFAVDRRKRPRPRGEEKDLSAIREAIAGGQFRAAHGEIRFKTRPTAVEEGNVPRADKCIGDFATLARACNRFYQGRLEADLQVLAHLGERQWTDMFRSLIAALKPALDDGCAMLLRVGRHSGAESVTLERHRWIRIMEGSGKAHWASEATTIWLAADRRDARTGLRPFGWLLLERADDLLAEDTLSRWCDQEMGADRSSPVDATVRPAGTTRPLSPAQGQPRQGDRVIYQEEAATIRQIDGSEALIAFEGGDTEWVPLDKLRRS